MLATVTPNCWADALTGCKFDTPLAILDHWCLELSTRLTCTLECPEADGDTECIHPDLYSKTAAVLGGRGEGFGALYCMGVFGIRSCTLNVRVGTTHSSCPDEYGSFHLRSCRTVIAALVRVILATICYLVLAALVVEQVLGV